MRTLMVLIAMLLLAAAGCDRPASRPAPAVPPSASATVPQHGDVQFVCQNLRPDGSKADSFSFWSRDAIAGVARATVKTGSPTEAEVTYRFVGRRGVADVYEVSHQFNSGNDRGRVAAEVEFTGTSVTALEVQDRRLSLAPKPAS